MRNPMMRTGVVCLLICLLLTPVLTHAAAKTYNVDFNDVDIRKVIETVSEITGKNFLVDDRETLFLGAGVRWSDDDLKYLLGSLPTGF